MELHAIEVDGVPAVWADVPGPLRAGLLFRVGEADERLIEHGVTHLVEHAAIRAAGREHSLGGTVGLLETHFDLWGGEERVVAGLSALCGALSALPRDGLDVERRVLAAEAAATGGPAELLLLLERCGARGAGVAGLDVFGLRSLDDEGVLAWAARWFVRGNAALWLSGPPPSGLRLDLPDGGRAAIPEAQPLPGLGLPGWAEGPPGGVAVGALADSAGDPLAMLVATALERRAYETLRATLGVSYSVVGRATPVASGTRHIVVAADCRDEHAPGTCEALLAAWRDVAGGAAIEEAHDEVLRDGRHALAEPEGMRAVLERNASRLLEGQAVVPPADMLERVSAAGFDDVAATAAALRDELIALVPGGVGRAIYLPPLTRPARGPLTGRRFKQRRAPHHVDSPRAIVVGEEGVTAEGDDDTATILFKDAVAAVERFGGALDLISADGLVVAVDPSDISEGDVAVRTVRNALPAEAIVPLDPRAARLQEAAADQFDRMWVVAPALEHVWPLLAWDEELRVLGETSRGLRPGVLVVTDRRVLIVTKVLGEQVHEWPRSAIRKASGRDVGVAARLRLEIEDGDDVSWWVGPRGRLKRVLAELNESDP